MNKVFLLLIAASCGGVLPARAASGCDAVINAILKVYQVPTHMYMTETAGANGGKIRNAETIYLNGVTFVMVSGKWQKSTISPKELADAKRESEQKTDTCSVVRDEAVNGEAATLYKVHNHTPDDTVDTQIWISKSRGLPLKQIYDIDVNGGARGKSHTEIHYAYTNVTAPPIEPRRR